MVPDMHHPCVIVWFVRLSSFMASGMTSCNMTSTHISTKRNVSMATNNGTSNVSGHEEAVWTVYMCVTCAIEQSIYHVSALSCVEVVLAGNTMRMSQSGSSRGHFPSVHMSPSRPSRGHCPSVRMSPSRPSRGGMSCDFTSFLFFLSTRNCSSVQGYHKTLTRLDIAKFMLTKIPDGPARWMSKYGTEFKHGYLAFRSHCHRKSTVCKMALLVKKSTL